MTFLTFRDLRSNSATELAPWTWEHRSVEATSAVYQAPKTKRQDVIAEVGWLIYSPVRATIATNIVESSNPPAGLRGIVFDYDVPLIRAHVVKLLGDLEEKLRPQYLEETLSGHFRMVWVFPREVAVPDGAFVEQLWKLWAKRIRAKELHSGLDSKSFSSFQRWTAGKEWLALGAVDATMPEAVLTELLVATAKGYRTDTKGEVSLTQVAEEVERKWPGKWTGEFVVGAQGVRFWDESADNPTGCMVKPDGMVCFTGNEAFVSWDKLLGAEWVRNASESRLDKAVGGIFYDGIKYWKQSGGGIWNGVSRQDMILYLQGLGFSDRCGKDETISEAGRLLLLIQDKNRVDAAHPYVNFAPGIVENRCRRYLNTTRIKAMEPASALGSVDPNDKFPFLWYFLNGLFARQEERPLEHWLAWLKRGYVGFREHKQLRGQVVFLCGPRENGKTLLHNRVLRPIFGGVSSNPYNYLMGSRFNEELSNSYLWVMDDAQAPKFSERGGVLSKLKGFAVNPTIRVEIKFGAAFEVECVIRLSISLNDGPADVQQIPDLDASTNDKFSLFATKRFAGVWPDSAEIETTLEKELPWFLRWLMDWEEPKDVLESSRMGVKSFFDSHLLRLATKSHFAYNFWEIVDSWMEASWGETGTPGATAERMVTPTCLLAELKQNTLVGSLCGHYRTELVHHCLLDLSRTPSSGVELFDPERRIFKLTRVKQNL